MKKNVIILTSLLVSTSFWGCSRPCPQKHAAESEKVQITTESLDSHNDKLNYAIAYDMGRSITRNQLDYNEAIFSKGLEDGMKDDTDSDNALMNEEERIQVKREHSMQMRDREKKERDEAGKANKEAAEKFLAENKGKEGIVVTQSGLQYKIITEADGPKPTVEDTVKVHYKGTLLDGTEFDSSHKRGEPATFPVGRVVRGWTEALQLMPVGSKWQLFIPPDLGYGERGAGGNIGPNTLLIFEVELIEIVDPSEVQQPAAQAKPNVRQLAAQAQAQKEKQAQTATKPKAAEPKKADEPKKEE